MKSLLKYPTLEGVIRVASALKITDQSLGIQSQFKLNNEQKKLLKEVLAGKKVLVLKSRQIGSSTILCLVDVLLAILNPHTKVRNICSSTGCSHRAFKQV